VNAFIRNPQTAANLDEKGMWGEVTSLTLWEAPIAKANVQILKTLAAATAPLQHDEIIRAETGPPPLLANETLESAFFALQNRWVIQKITHGRGPSRYQIAFGLLYQWIRTRFGLVN